METRQMSLFESTFDRFLIDRPIRLIELFAGIGAQSKALENLGADFESHRVVEWSCNSIIAYNAIHVGDFNDYSQNLSKEEILERVRGVSIDYNKPATDAELLRRGEKWLRKLYSSMVAIKDLCPDVSRVHADSDGQQQRLRAGPRGRWRSSHVEGGEGHCPEAIVPNDNDRRQYDRSRGQKGKQR